MQMVKDTIMDPRTQSLIGFFISQRIQTEAHVTIGKRNYGSRNTISDRDLYLTQDDTSKHTGRQEQRSARYIQMQGHNATRRQAPPDHEQWLFCIILRDVQMFLLKIALDWE